ncbi:Protease Do-like 1, chloroplastic [Apostasia shenzhenica]|uniref:Protease Do-like 1, chloroplastic n=1 Tax=Apostasia shenzhenica TaxID=1088818 RepID=A0A2I0B2M0_9ASPA|nr:Protease Do-like 1, chloroplastic [Apostasia shenzhenica]
MAAAAAAAAQPLISICSSISSSSSSCYCPVSLRRHSSAFRVPPNLSWKGFPVALFRQSRRTRVPAVAASPSASSIPKIREDPGEDRIGTIWAAIDSVVVLLASAALSLSLFLADVNPASAFVVTTPRKLQTDELATVRLFQENTPSVVYITNLAVRQDAFTLDVLEVPQGSGSGFLWDKEGHIVTNYHVIRGASDLRQDAFTLDVLEVPQGSGSGFLWDKEGHIVTNYHVIRGASDLRVTLADQSTYDANVVGFDQDKDVAVLRIDAPKDKLRPIPIGVSADLLVGQKVYAIGNPFGLDHTLTTGVIRYLISSFAYYLQFGLDHTLTTGVISGLRREISSAATGRPIQDVIQTDAAINPGNSGGPLLDSSGNLIGINTAIYSPSGASSGVGFSIPVDTVGGIVEQLVKFGKVTRPILGIKFAPDQSVEQLGVSGVLVLDAPPTGPAGKAGLKPTKRDAYGRLVLGDIITSVNGKKVVNGSDLYRILDQCKVGDTVVVEVLRGDHKEKLPVVLEPKPDES